MKEMFNVKVDGQTHHYLKVMAAYTGSTIQSILMMIVEDFYESADIPESVRTDMKTLIKERNNKSRE